MKNKPSALTATAVAALFFMCTPASATSIEFVDFREFSEGSGPVGHNITFNATTFGGDLYWDSIDGYGVMGGENDEVDGIESLTISFSSPLHQLNQVFITDLFTENNTTELGTFSINGGGSLGNFYGVEALDGINNGELTLNLESLGLMNVSSIEFWIPRDMFGTVPAGYEFSVRGIGAVVMPEPSTLILFASGLFGMVVLTRIFIKRRTATCGNVPRKGIRITITFPKRSKPRKSFESGP